MAEIITNTCAYFAWIRNYNPYHYYPIKKWQKYLISSQNNIFKKSIKHFLSFSLTTYTCGKMQENLFQLPGFQHEKETE